jgi:hypothetical protein
MEKKYTAALDTGIAIILENFVILAISIVFAEVGLRQFFLIPIYYRLKTYLSVTGYQTAGFN